MRATSATQVNVNFKDMSVQDISELIDILENQVTKKTGDDVSIEANPTGTEATQADTPTTNQTKEVVSDSANTQTQTSQTNVTESNPDVHEAIPLQDSTGLWSPEQLAEQLLPHPHSSSKEKQQQDTAETLEDDAESNDSAISNFF